MNAFTRLTAVWKSAVYWCEYRHPIAAWVLTLTITGILTTTLGALWLLCII